MPLGRLDLRTKKLRFIRRLPFKKSLFFFGVILLTVGLYKFFTTFFLVKTIKIAGTQVEVLGGIEKLGGQNLLFLDKFKWEDRLQKENPTLKEIKIEKEFPAQLLIKFKKREPKAIIFDQKSSTSFSIDEEGVILKKGREEKRLAVIIASLQNFKIGDRIKNKNIKLVLKLISALEESSEGTKFEVDESLKILNITLSNGNLILINLEKEQEETIYSLQMLLKKFKIEGKWPKRIDLRFKKPILTY